MGEALIVIEGLTEAAKLANTLTAKWQAGEVVLSETDVAAVHEALLQAEAATAALRPQVDAALDAASKR